MCGLVRPYSRYIRTYISRCVRESLKRHGRLCGGAVAAAVRCVNGEKREMKEKNVRCVWDDVMMMCAIGEPDISTGLPRQSGARIVMGNMSLLLVAAAAAAAAAACVVVPIA